MLVPYNSVTKQASSRGKTLHKVEQCWVALDLNNLEQPFSDQVHYLVSKAREKSVNFENEGAVLLPNSSHFFLKLHMLTDSSRLVTLSLVDLAGYPDQPGTSNTEINNSINLMLYLFRDMMHTGQALQKHGMPSQAIKPTTLNKQSKILKEFNKLFAQGQFKVSFLHMVEDDGSKYEAFAR
jgi:hypothetical protein